jgi:Predicted membrane protein (DUF2306)
MILHVSPGSPWWVVVGAQVILVTHISGGCIGILSGAMALIARKGERLHRAAGTVFFVSMLITAAIGAVVGPFLPVPQWDSVANGVLTFYLVATAWLTVRRKERTVGRAEAVGMAAALGVAAYGAACALVAMNSPAGTIGDAPPAAFLIFFLLGAIGAAGDVKVIVRGGISGAGRISRHLWRMCTALTIATFTFATQPKAMRFLPSFLHGTPSLVLAALPLFALAFWLIRVRFVGPLNKAAVAS